ncbi:TetR/AcrR family transcriptional regulator [Pseudochrobactrum kiredjianiae]|uniref:TetR/AcrR family transcriptional regulator n=1 Tax=Pseudochrobactrum kiredjianiae TaxID=386305 RepID=A0ABW3V8Q9_9HYPH|nr:TetR/AcrR family transcriptional regulator [Pseudochrobactrum kiredjianiae]MDM7851417.1 TetR/AcrR family transcriptional regulator [Pseudochrobactrum kiredjianiae]
MESKKHTKIGRPRTIDRNHLLDLAEKIVVEHGATALTVDALAKAAGITKGGVQYCFGTKDGLVDAMLTRWGNKFDKKVTTEKNGKTDRLSHIAAHIRVTRDSDPLGDSRFAAMLAALIPNSEHLADTRQWYRQQLSGLDISTEQGRNARLAFIANEGAFLLRSFKFFDLNEDEWQQIFRDIEKLLPPEIDD